MLASGNPLPGLPMPSHEIKEFAKLLIQYVRDQAIENSDVTARPVAAGPTARRWKAIPHGNNLEAMANVIVPDAVDETIFCLLDAIDNGNLKLSFTAENGKTVNLSEEGLGELAGWHLGSSDGWRAIYSKRRFFDDNADLRHFNDRDKEPG
jgi:hypothetical protein